jgi:hypothetical protein
LPTSCPAPVAAVGVSRGEEPRAAGGVASEGIRRAVEAASGRAARRCAGWRRSRSERSRRVGWEAGTRTPKEPPTYGKTHQRIATLIPRNLNESGPCFGIRSLRAFCRSWKKLVKCCAQLSTPRTHVAQASGLTASGTLLGVTARRTGRPRTERSGPHDPAGGPAVFDRRAPRLGTVLRPKGSLLKFLHFFERSARLRSRRANVLHYAA